jgi:hypothetical protein
VVETALGDIDTTAVTFRYATNTVGNTDPSSSVMDVAPEDENELDVKLL